MYNNGDCEEDGMYGVLEFANKNKIQKKKKKKRLLATYLNEYNERC